MVLRALLRIGGDVMAELIYLILMVNAAALIGNIIVGVWSWTRAHLLR